MMFLNETSVTNKRKLQTKQSVSSDLRLVLGMSAVSPVTRDLNMGVVAAKFKFLIYFLRNHLTLTEGPRYCQYLNYTMTVLPSTAQEDEVG